MNREIQILSVLILLVLIAKCLYKKKTEGFQSYAYPWQVRNNWAWNWYPRWNWPTWRRKWFYDRWKPRCPVGCQWTGEKYGCPNPSLAYGNFACKYDFDCDGCNWGWDGNYSN